MSERRLICPQCHGSKRQPSAVTKVRDWCSFCEGAGWFLGHPSPLPSIEQHLVTLQGERNVG